MWEGSAMEKRGGEVLGQKEDVLPEAEAWKSPQNTVVWSNIYDLTASVGRESPCGCAEASGLGFLTKLSSKLSLGLRSPWHLWVGRGRLWPQARPRDRLRILLFQDHCPEPAISSWPVGLSQDRSLKQLFLSEGASEQSYREPGRKSCNLWLHHLHILSIKSRAPHKKKWNWVICSEVDGPRVCHTEWRKSDREKQTPYDLTHMWNIKDK